MSNQMTRQTRARLDKYHKVNYALNNEIVVPNSLSDPKKAIFHLLQKRKK